MMHSCGWRNFILRLLGFVYLIAFTSLLVQAPGLYGNKGLLPISKIVDQVARSQPGVLWRARPDEIGVEKWLDLICMGGIVPSLLVCMGWVYAPLMAACWICYLSVNLVGQTFIPFQWDIFMLEVGGLAILYAPGSPLTKTRRPSRVVVLALHWCLFKIMIMSGVVKLQSRCPTWWGLTALHYHYATQCIPTPVAWLAHQMPNFIQKLSVAATFLIEMPCTVLIIAPWREARVLGAYVNILLMALIMATGNYTFFNLLTLALCLTLLEGEHAWWLPPPTADVKGKPQKMQAVVEELQVKQSNNASSVLQSDQHKKALDGNAASSSPPASPDAEHLLLQEPSAPLLWRTAGWAAALLWLVWSFHAMFHVTLLPAAADAAPRSAWELLEHGLDIRVRFSFEEMDAWVQLLLLWSVPMFLLRLGYEAWADCATPLAPTELSAAGLAACPTLRIPNTVPRQWSISTASLLPAAATGTGTGTGAGAGRSVVTLNLNASGGARAAGPLAAKSRAVLVVLWWANFAATLLLALAYFFASLSPLSQICPALAALRPQLSDPLFSTARAWFLVSGYGLFRRMTGVGQASAVLANSGGASIPKVARPELELQGSDDGKEWKALEFRFKPGNVSAAPAWTGFPGFAGSFSGMHQPRLDWQMWFAALGSYQHNPWLVSLVIHLLRGSADAKALMAPELWPPEWAGAGKAPKQIRIIKFEYDFSRLNSTDAANGKWWSRKRVGEYLPPLTKDHPAIAEFQRSVGLDRPLDSKEKGEAQGATWVLKQLAVAVRAHTLLVVRLAMGLGLAVSALALAAAILPTRAAGRGAAPTAPPRSANAGEHLKSA